MPVISFAAFGQQGRALARGFLNPVSGDTLEHKSYFNSGEIEAPRILFAVSQNQSVTLSLHRTAAGFAGTLHCNGSKYGCNLNRVRNRKGRWALTVWVTDATASPPLNPEQVRDLFGGAA